MANDLITYEQVLEETKKAVAETLNIDLQKVTPESSLIKDLGAESLDFLDINYRLEQKFGIKMARQFILEHVEELYGEGSAIDDTGKLTEKAIELLKIRLGDKAKDLKHGIYIDEVTSLITVSSLAQGVMEILKSLPEKCQSCGASSWKIGEELQVQCSSCGEPAEYANGDDLIRQYLEKVQAEKKIF
ncbi:MAG: phosphopantetheine-binding protein [Thermodesulfovibrionales bacterium]|nr:phosphopantetheine-binding protein [Thermodesulfovibrionales bacterium]